MIIILLFHRGLKALLNGVQPVPEYKVMAYNNVMAKWNCAMPMYRGIRFMDVNYFMFV